MAPTGLAINASSGAIDPSNSEQGSYEVTYTLDGTCPISSMQVITVNDALDPSWAAPQSVCANATIISLDELITGDGGGIWSGQGVNAAMFDPAVVEGSSLVTYTVGSGSCEQSSSATIVVTPAPQANGGADAFTCDPEYQLSANAFGGTGIWSTDGMAQFLPNASDPNAIVTGAGPGTYVLFWTVSNDVCSSTDTIRITFLDPATDLTIDAGQDQILEVETNTFLEATTTPGANVTWTLLNGSNRRSWLGYRSQYIHRHGVIGSMYRYIGYDRRAGEGSIHSTRFLTERGWRQRPVRSDRHGGLSGKRTDDLQPLGARSVLRPSLCQRLGRKVQEWKRPTQ